MIGKVIVTGRQISGVPPVVVEGSGVNAGGLDEYAGTRRTAWRFEQQCGMTDQSIYNHFP
jgi:hypothetical protein